MEIHEGDIDTAGVEIIEFLVCVCEKSEIIFRVLCGVIHTRLGYKLIRAGGDVGIQKQVSVNVQDQN